MGPAPEDALVACALPLLVSVRNFHPTLSYRCHKTPRHLVCSPALNLSYSQQQRTPRHQHAQPHLERKNHSVTMAEDNEELNIRQPEQTDQNEEATPDPSAPPEKKGSTIGIIPTFILLYST